MSFLPAPQQLEILKKGSVEILREEELLAKLERSRAAGRPLRVKVGFDPSAPDIHLGHTVLIRKMKHFQDLGHEVIFVIGDFTGLIGDPTGVSKTRPALTREQVDANAETYRRQVFKLLDPQATRVEFNSRWLGSMTSYDWVRLASKYTVARILERDDFTKRFKASQPIGIHEFLYPLAQAYDSVALEADVEMGGTDQKFNLLVGREIMREFAMEPQVVLTMPLLEGTDGVEKMSKSLGNYIGIDEPPREIFGKVLSISDDLMWRYYELCTDLSLGEIAALREKVTSGEVHPKQAKQDLAKRIVADFHSAHAAESAQAEFERIFVSRQTPDEVESLELPCSAEPLWLPKLLVLAGMAKSNAEASRLIRQGGVALDGARVESSDFELAAAAPAEHLLKVGKRRFVRIRFR
ncbi:MAG TPA: tyrosine--tRNA ligase [Candidatus Polarisedimenticolia bacterium]|nr:tyrosine--tRNA ligase [Candidatus Polarisedimenticolia bacterium]